MGNCFGNTQSAAKQATLEITPDKSWKAYYTCTIPVRASVFSRRMIGLACAIISGKSLFFSAQCCVAFAGQLYTPRVRQRRRILSIGFTRPKKRSRSTTGTWLRGKCRMCCASPTRISICRDVVDLFGKRAMKSVRKWTARKKKEIHPACIPSATIWVLMCWFNEHPMAISCQGLVLFHEIWLRKRHTWEEVTVI